MALGFRSVLLSTKPPEGPIIRERGQRQEGTGSGMLFGRVGEWVAMASTTRSEKAPTLKMLRERREEILAAAARHGASNVRVYGSVARGDARPASDIDVLVDVKEGRSLLDLAALHLELEDLLGFSVEIGTDVKPRLRERVRTEAVVL